jgi:hypothetical protein
MKQRLHIIKNKLGRPKGKKRMQVSASIEYLKTIGLLTDKGLSDKKAIEVGINIVGGRFCYNEGDE